MIDREKKDNNSLDISRRDFCGLQEQGCWPELWRQCREEEQWQQSSQKPPMAPVHGIC